MAVSVLDPSLYPEALPARAPAPHPDPTRWAVETFGVVKRFPTRRGLPPGWGLGSAHWIVSSLLKYRQGLTWCRAVDGVDLKIGRGELFGLLGPNGAGKTSLIKCLATLLTVDEGDAFIDGASVRTDPDRVRLSVNLVGTGHWGGFDWGLTVSQNLEFFAALYGLGRAERRRRIAETLEQLGLARFARATPRTLSTGERQRMLLAKGFLVRTPVFFLDEPTVGLDPEGARQVREFLRDRLVGRSGTTALLTTHRMSEAEALCSRIGIMARGRLVACGSPLELKRLAGQETVLEVRGRGISQELAGRVRGLAGVRALGVAPVGGESLEDSLRIHGEDLDRLAGRVVDLLSAGGAEVASVDFEEPNLEDAFLALTDERLAP